MYCARLNCWQLTDNFFCESCDEILLKLYQTCATCHGSGLQDYGQGAFSHCSKCLHWENDFIETGNVSKIPLPEFKTWADYIEYMHPTIIVGEAPKIVTGKKWNGPIEF